MEKKIVSENMQGRTLEVIVSDINTKVDALNAEKEMAKRITIEAEVDGLIKEYNDLSLLTAYATCKAEAMPIMALAKMCKYSTVSKKKTPSIELVDGASKRVEVFAVTKKDTVLNVLKFIKWLEERNFKMPEGWIGRMSAVKAEVIDQWKAFDDSQGDEHVFNKKKLRRLVQAMVNDMGFIPGEKGGNALVVKNEHINTLIKYANEKTGVQSGKTLSAKNWDGHLMTILNGLATGAVFENSYGSASVYKDDAVTADDGSEAEGANDNGTTEGDKKPDKKSGKKPDKKKPDTTAPAKSK